jgi:hypothetical protein
VGPNLETSQETAEMFVHKSKPVQLAAKQAHKRMLHKMRSKWYQQLNEGSSESSGEDDADYFDQLNNDIRNLNFNSNTDNYFSGNRSTRLNRSDMINNIQPYSISRRERNQLKTNTLRNSLTKLMLLAPDRSRIWNVEPFPKINK